MQLHGDRGYAHVEKRTCLNNWWWWCVGGGGGGGVGGGGEEREEGWRGVVVVVVLTVCIDDVSVHATIVLHLVLGLCPCGHDHHGRVPVCRALKSHPNSSSPR